MFKANWIYIFVINETITTAIRITNYHDSAKEKEAGATEKKSNRKHRDPSGEIRSREAPVKIFEWKFSETANKSR